MEDTAVHPDGNFYFRIRNTSTSTVTITTVSIAGLDAVFDSQIYFDNSREFVASTNIHCEEWTHVAIEVYVKYKTGYGLEKVQRYPAELGMLCEKFVLLEPEKAAYTTVNRLG